MRVLLVDRQSSRVSTLRAAIEDAGFTVVDVVSDRADLYAEVARLAPDTIIVSADSPSRDILDDVASMGENQPRPLLMLSSQDDRALMAEASAAGIAAYVTEGLSPALVRSLIDVAVRQYEQMASLRAELAAARETLADRQAVHRAKCLLMEQQGLSEDAAYRYLRKTAMNRALPMVELARQILVHAAD